MEKQNQEFTPYIPADKKVPEYTFKSIFLGMILAIVFAMVMTYLGLKVGMTVSASIPAAVISMAILRGLLKKGTILENNIVQTIASAGEAVAGGVIFTLPAVFVWRRELQAVLDLYLPQIILIIVIGSVLGVLFMIPLRRYLIVQEHKTLPYPEGTACAEVLIAGEVGGNQAKCVFFALGIAAAFRLIMSGFKAWIEYPKWVLAKSLNLVLTFDNLPALLGVGFIIGLRVSAFMLAGGLLSWFILIPAISYFGLHLTSVLAPGKILISQMSPDQIWSSYIRYIGAGAVAIGGLISLGKAMPTIFSSFVLGFKEVFHGLKGTLGAKSRTETDLGMPVVILGSLFMVFLLAILPQIPLGTITLHRILGALMVVIFGFFFVTVSSRIVGIVGSSSNPVSGMTIGTLLVTTLIFRAAGWSGIDGMMAALTVGALVCIGIGMAGDTSQDLKTGYLVGATPKYQQYGMVIGSLASSFFVAWTVLYLCKTYVVGSTDLPAPQANLMAIVIQGIMEGNLPWGLIFIGGAAAVVAELMGVPALPFAVGMYLPLELSTTVMLGGIISWLVTKSVKPQMVKPALDRGLLVASGLIAGDAIMGIVIAALDANKIEISQFFPLHAGSNIVSLIFLLLMGAYLWWDSRRSLAGRGRKLTPEYEDLPKSD